MSVLSSENLRISLLFNKKRKSLNFFHLKYFSYLIISGHEFKLLVAIGVSNTGYTGHAEIIDLNNPQNVCFNLKTLPMLEKSTAALIEGNPFICGILILFLDFETNFHSKRE
jgi:hypothetical protein